MFLKHSLISITLTTPPFYFICNKLTIFLVILTAFCSISYPLHYRPHEPSLFFSLTSSLSPSYNPLISSHTAFFHCAKIFSTSFSSSLCPYTIVVTFCVHSHKLLCTISSLNKQILDNLKQKKEPSCYGKLRHLSTFLASYIDERN